MPSQTVRHALLALFFVALLAVLAFLQYRWIGEIRDAERERLRASAEAAADGVAEDFGRELARLVRSFGEPLHSDEATVGVALASARDRWRGEMRFPSILAALSVARRGADGSWSLSTLDDTGRLVPASWSDDLAMARASLEQDPRAREVPGFESRRGRGGPPPVPFVRFFGDAPLLLLARPDAGGALLVRMDRNAIATELLPSLVSAHFGRRPDYSVAVLGAGDPRPVIYRSDPAFTPPASPGAADVEAPLLSPRPGFATGRRERPGPPPGEGPPLRGAPPEERGWLLVATHRAGSLDAAVGATRRRNLAVSAGILGLLVAAVGFLATSAGRAARLARQKVEFVAALTHELRTPLAAIRSAGQNLSDGIVGEPRRVRDYGGLIARESRRLSMLIENALAQAGIEARGDAVRSGAASLTEAVSEAVEACRPLADERGASVEAELPADLPPVAADEPALRTLMENLLSNAIKYGGDRGRVTVSAAADGGSVRVSVRDRGPGISAADLPRIFEPFYRGRGAGPDGSGSGLGLSLVRRIVDGLGGRIAVQSAAGEGTVFTVSLPAAFAAAGGETG